MGSAGVHMEGRSLKTASASFPIEAGTAAARSPSRHLPTLSAPRTCTCRCAAASSPCSPSHLSRQASQSAASLPCSDGRPRAASSCCCSAATCCCSARTSPASPAPLARALRGASCGSKYAASLSSCTRLHGAPGSAGFAGRDCAASTAAAGPPAAPPLPTPPAPPHLAGRGAPPVSGVLQLLLQALDLLRALLQVALQPCVLHRQLPALQLLHVHRLRPQASGNGRPGHWFIVQLQVWPVLQGILARGAAPHQLAQATPDLLHPP